jgi:hypothetical protein
MDARKITISTVCAMGARQRDAAPPLLDLTFSHLFMSAYYSLRSCPLQRRLRWPQDGEIDREKQSRRRYDSRSLVADLATPCESRLVAGARGA